MPTKLNRAGNQQNYVPAGNGDASGEYGDQATGSNKHFTAFQKPKKETRTKELSKKQKREIYSYLRGRNIDDPQKSERIIKDLRYYTGSFGDLSGFSDDELKDIMKEISNYPTSEDYVYYKEGGQWKLTRNTGLLDALGTKYYTKEERDAKEQENNLKLIESSQNEFDKKIQETMGNNCIVCFGKGYSKEDLKQIEDDTKVLVNDYPELKEYVKLMGDRNNLEKLLNAQKTQRELTEQEIADEVARIKKYTIFSSGGEDSYRRQAINNLRSPIKFQKLASAYAYWSDGFKGMLFMGKMKKLTDEQKDYEFNTNFKSSNKRNATFNHEMGHAVDYALEYLYNSKLKDIEKQAQEKQKETGVYDNQYYYKMSDLRQNYSQFRIKLQNLYEQNYNKEYKEKFNSIFKEKYGSDYDTRFYDQKKYEAEKYTKEELKKQGIKKYTLSEYGNTNIKEFVAESFSAYYTGMNNPLANQVVDLIKDISNKLREV